MNIHKYFIIPFLILCIAFSSNRIFAAEKVEPVTAPSTTLQLTDAERAWLAEHPAVEIHMTDSTPPYMYRAENGSAAGILPDLLDVIEERIGIRFNRKLDDLTYFYENIPASGSPLFGLWNLRGVDPDWTYRASSSVVKGYITASHVDK